MLAGLLQGVGKLYLLTRAVRFPALLQDAGTYQRIVADWHGRIAQAILRNWEIAEEVVSARRSPAKTIDATHEGATDLTDVMAVGAALAALGPGPACRADAVPRHAGRAPHEARREILRAALRRIARRKSRRCARRWAHEPPAERHLDGRNARIAEHRGVRAS